jgi:hypothetical protein
MLSIIVCFNVSFTSRDLKLSNKKGGNKSRRVNTLSRDVGKSFCQNIGIQFLKFLITPDT